MEILNRVILFQNACKGLSRTFPCHDSSICESNQPSLDSFSGWILKSKVNLIFPSSIICFLSCLQVWESQMLCKTNLHCLAMEAELSSLHLVSCLADAKMLQDGTFFESTSSAWYPSVCRKFLFYPDWYQLVCTHTEHKWCDSWKYF